MGRQPLWRRVSNIPDVTYFKPVGIPLSHLQEVRLSIEAAEAIRLKDLEDLEQEDCARKMNVSRTTFSRVLNSARQAIADAILNGKAIRIEGGNYEVASRRYRCINGHEWEVPAEEVSDTAIPVCPTCQTPNVIPVWPGGPGWGGRGRRRGRNW
jgi:predicted DNA-binding protein (UPF0251 family)